MYDRLFSNVLFSNFVSKKVQRLWTILSLSFWLVGLAPSLLLGSDVAAQHHPTGPPSASTETEAPAAWDMQPQTVGGSHPFTGNGEGLEDPAFHTDLNGICTWRLTCGSTRAQMRWTPPGPFCFADASSNMPLVILLRGNGFGYRDYDYLQTHLARNGILSASVDVVAQPTATAHTNAANRVVSYLDSTCFDDFFVERFSSPNPIDFENMAIVGHSRGGETARFLADQLDSRAEYAVKAVVAMAPTFHTEKTIDGQIVEAFMMLYGSLDPDVTAQNAFASHDLAGRNEFSTPSPLDIDRSMKLLQGGDHAGFSDESFFGSGEAQRRVTRGYVHAFLRAWLRNDWRFYHNYVRGQSVPGGWSSVFHQFSTESKRLVVDNFEDGSAQISTVGGLVVPINVTGGVVEGPLDETPHAGKYLRFQPSSEGASVHWVIPEGALNLNNVLYLSFRIGQLTDGESTSAHVRVVGDLGTTSVNLDAYGGVPRPTTMCLESQVGLCTDPRDQGHMQTIRIPLSHFGSIGSFRSVILDLDYAADEEFIVDNLEFVDRLFIDVIGPF